MGPIPRLGVEVLVVVRGHDSVIASIGHGQKKPIKRFLRSDESVDDAADMAGNAWGDGLRSP